MLVWKQSLKRLKRLTATRRRSLRGGPWVRPSGPGSSGREQPAFPAPFQGALDPPAAPGQDVSTQGQTRPEGGGSKAFIQILMPS